MEFTSTFSPKMIVITEEGLANIMASILPKMIYDGIKNYKEEELQHKLCNPTESRKILGGISRPTLESIADQGLIKKIYVGGKVFFKYKDLLSAQKSFKKYSRKPIAQA